MSLKMSPQEKINEAINDLEKAVNNSIVNYENVKTALLRVHPYLLNIIAKGVCGAIHERKHDGRISVSVLSGILEHGI